MAFTYIYMRTAGCVTDLFAAEAGYEEGRVKCFVFLRKVAQIPSVRQRKKMLNARKADKICNKRKGGIEKGLITIAQKSGDRIG